MLWGLKSLLFLKSIIFGAAIAQWNGPCLPSFGPRVKSMLFTFAVKFYGCVATFYFFHLTFAVVFLSYKRSVGNAGK